MAVPLRIAVLGTGYMALKAYLPAFRRQGAVIHSLWGRSIQRVQELAERFGVPNVYIDEHACIADPSVDAVVIAAPNALHHHLLTLAADARKAVLCEKPLALSLDQAADMYAKASRAGIFHAVPYLWRLPDHAQEARALTEAGFLGQVYECHAVFSVGGWADPQNSMGWRGRAELAGAGVLADLGGHVSDLARWYAGEIQEVIGQGTTHVPARQTPSGDRESVTVIDSCNALLHMKEGAQGTFHLSYVDLARELFLRMELHGSAAAIVYELEMEGDSLSTRLGLRRLRGSELTWASKRQPFSELLDRFCAEFLRGVREGHANLPTLQDGVLGQAVIEAVTKSLASRHWEPVLG